MKIDFTPEITDLDGTPIRIAESDKPLTLSEVCITALLNPVDEAAKTTGPEKARWFQLAMTIRNGAAEISVDDVALLKRLVGSYFAPLVVGRAYEMLDPQEQPAL